MSGIIPGGYTCVGVHIETSGGCQESFLVTVLPYSLGHTSQSDLHVDNMVSLLAVALRTSNLSAARITGELPLPP